MTKTEKNYWLVLSSQLYLELRKQYSIKIKIRVKKARVERESKKRKIES